MASSAEERAAGMAILRVISVTFLYISPQPHFDLQPVYITAKRMKHRFQRYIVRTEILSTFHTRVEYISRQTIRHFARSNEWDANAKKCQKPCQKQPLPLETRGLHLIHECLGLPHSPPQTAPGSNEPFRHNTLCGHTYIHRWSRRMFHTMSASLAMLIESDAIIITDKK